MNRKTRRFIGFAGIAVITAVTLGGIFTLSTTSSVSVHAQSSVRPPPDAVTPGSVPSSVDTNVLPASDMWRAVRKGISGRVSIPDQKAAVLVQSEGENFRAARNGPLSVWGGWLMLAVIVLLAVFFAVRGRIEIEGGTSGRTIERFNTLDRFTHWLTAISFIVLALSGLNMLYGRYVLLPVIGPSAFSAISIWGKYLHNYVAFAFMIGIVLTFVLWVRHNLPTRADWQWLKMGGGMFSKGKKHPPAYKFNAGQKILFWLVVLGGTSISVSGLALLWPFEFHLFGPTFAVFNIFGAGLPTELTVLQETQLSLIWHAVVALVLIAAIIAHIYIGTIGMEGALDAMTTGEVDANWVREHHPLWLEEIEGRGGKRGRMQPAE